MRLTIAGAALAVIAVAAPAAAQQHETALMRCAGISDSEARLGCYDAIAADLSPAAKTMIAERQAEDAARKAAAAAAVEAERVAKLRTAEEAFGYEQVASGEGREARDLDSITSTVSDTAKNAGGRVIVFLANGQIWSSEDSISTRIKEGQEVTIERTLGGGYKLDQGRRPFRARRVR